MLVSYYAVTMTLMQKDGTTLVGGDDSDEH